MADTSVMSASPHMEAEHSATGAFLRTLVIGLTAFLTVVDLFATQAILPSLVKHYQVSRAAMGFAVNASTIGMAVAGLDRRLLQPAHRPPPRHPAEPGAALDPDGAAGGGARSHHLHDPAHRAGSVHGVGLHAHADLSGGAVQRQGRRHRLGRLHHRQRRQQPVRPPDVGRPRRPSRAWRRTSTSSPDSTWPARSWSISRSAQTRPMAAAGAAVRSSFAIWAEHLRNGPLRASFGIGFLHPVRLHRHLHLREFRPGRRPHRGQPDAAGLRLSRLPALDPDDAAGRPGGAAPGHAADLLGRPGGRRRRPAAAAAAQPHGGAGRPGAGRRRHLLRPGGGDRLHRPRRDHRPRLGQRHLSRLLLLRRHRRHAPSSASSSTGWDGRPASAASPSPSLWPRCSPCG